MQIATMTTFPGPCRNVVLFPDRGFMKQRKRCELSAMCHYQQLKKKEEKYLSVGAVGGGLLIFTYHIPILVKLSHLATKDKIYTCCEFPALQSLMNLYIGCYLMKHTGEILTKPVEYRIYHDIPSYHYIISHYIFFTYKKGFWR